MIAQSDDVNEYRQVEKLSEGFVRHPNVGVAFSRSALIDGSGRVIGDDFFFREPAFQRFCGKTTVVPGPVMEKFVFKTFVLPNLRAALIRKDLYEKMNGLSPDRGSAADWDFWCRLSRETDFYYVVEPLNRFRTHNGTIRSGHAPCHQFSEILALLCEARARTTLSARETLVFKTNLGFTWANSIIHHPLHWFAHGLDALRLVLRYDKSLPFFVSVGFLLRLSKALSALIAGAGPARSGAARR